MYRSLVAIYGGNVEQAVAWMVGAVAMPIVCFAAAWRKPLRNLFFIPVLGLLVGGVLTCWVLAAGGVPLI